MRLKKIILNYIRRLFTIRVLESWLFKRLEKKPKSIFSKFIPDDNFYNPGSIRLIKKRGINYELDISNIVDNYLYFGIEDYGYKPITEHIKNARIIIDIGANIGSTSLFFASLNKNGKIIAFEPHTQTFKKTNKNISLNQFNNITLVNMGLGEQKGSAKLFEINPKNPGMNRILKGELDQPFSEIKIDTLDSYVKDNGLQGIDFIKIDVEGYEYQVLKGAISTLKEHFPTLYIELDDDNLHEHGGSAHELVTFLYDIGYKSIKNSETLSEILINDSFKSCHFDIIVSNKM